MMITLTEAAKITGKSAVHLRSLCRTGKIEGAQLIGKTYIVPESWANTYRRDREDTFSVREAAELAGVSSQAIYLAINSGKLGKKGKRISKDSLFAYIQSRSGKPLDEPS
ncbi:helix-turn-helix domain-containing protein [Cloacibacillus porcorum]